MNASPWERTDGIAGTAVLSPATGLLIHGEPRKAAAGRAYTHLKTTGISYG